jgi:hypothetical protein
MPSVARDLASSYRQVLKYSAAARNVSIVFGSLVKTPSDGRGMLLMAKALRVRLAGLAD